MVDAIFGLLDILPFVSTIKAILYIPFKVGNISAACFVRCTLIVIYKNIYTSILNEINPRLYHYK